MYIGMGIKDSHKRAKAAVEDLLNKEEDEEDDEYLRIIVSGHCPTSVHFNQLLEGSCDICKVKD